MGNLFWLAGIPIVVFVGSALCVAYLNLADRFDFYAKWWSLPLWMAFGFVVMPGGLGGIMYCLYRAFRASAP